MRSEPQNTCPCCGHSTSSAYCPRCGFLSGAVTGGTFDADGAQRAAQEYRKALIDRLGEILLLCHRYEWDAAEQRHRQIQDFTQPVSAAKLLRQPVRFANIAHVLRDDGTAEPVPVQFQYRLDGELRQGGCVLNPRPDPGRWTLGMAMNDRLQLVLYLGTDPSRTLELGQAVDLDLRRPERP